MEGLLLSLSKSYVSGDFVRDLGLVGGWGLGVGGWGLDERGRGKGRETCPKPRIAGTGGGVCLTFAGALIPEKTYRGQKHQSFVIRHIKDGFRAMCHVDNIR